MVISLFRDSAGLVWHGNRSPSAFALVDHKEYTTLFACARTEASRNKRIQQSHIRNSFIEMSKRTPCSLTRQPIGHVLTHSHSFAPNSKQVNRTDSRLSVLRLHTLYECVCVCARELIVQWRNDIIPKMNVARAARRVDYIWLRSQVAQRRLISARSQVKQAETYTSKSLWINLMYLEWKLVRDNDKRGPKRN